MPFDMAPQETKVGKFQDVADAILRGCGIHKRQAVGIIYDADEKATCVMGAAFIGLGYDVTRSVYMEHWDTQIGKRLQKLMENYKAAYGAIPQVDNNNRGMTREQIAARIAAL